MRSKIVLTAAFALVGIALPMANAQGQLNLGETRTALQEWVEFRKLISEEENDWRAEKETLEESIRLIKSEMERLDNEMKDIEEGSTAAEVEREKLDSRNAELKQAASAVGDVIVSLEQAIVKVHARFPSEMQKKIEPLFNRIPKEGKSSSAGTGQRLQNIVGILSEIEKFNRTITVTSEIQDLPDGTSAQVDTIYLGLAVGYFVDGTNSYAGILTPAEGGWEATQADDLALDIRTAVDVYNNATLAQFVELPVDLK